MTTRFNEPNYKAYCMVFLPKSPLTEADMYYEQVVKLGKESVESMNNRIVEVVEGLHSVTGLHYRLCLPTDHRNPDWSRGCRYVNIGW